MPRVKARKNKIFILGAGFAGLYSALTLKKNQRFLKDFEIVIIDKESHFLFTPLMVNVLSKKLDKALVKEDLAYFFSNIKILAKDITKIDFKKQVLISKEKSFKYDYLIIATGAKTNYFNIKGAKENSRAIKFFKHLGEIEKAIKKIETSQKFKRIVIAGGGPTGVETALELSDRLKEKQEKKLLEILIIDKNKKPLAQMPEFLIKKAQEVFLKNKIKFIGNKEITAVYKNYLLLALKEKIKHSLLIWSGGVKPNLMETISNNNHKNIDPKKGFLQEKNLLLKGEKSVFVIGDCAFSINSLTQEPYPKLAQSAVKQGKLAAKNLLRLIQNRPLKNFKFKKKGLIVPLGKNNAAAQIFGINFNGPLAKLLWKIVYILNFPSYRKKFSLVKRFLKLKIN
jgi:NADH dehydrogenase